jgi:hypothetical protein
MIGTACTSALSADKRRVVATCATAPVLTSAEYCSACTPLDATCHDNRPVDACCAWVQAPAQDAVRSTHVHEFAAADGVTAPNLACLAAPPAVGASRHVTLQGFVRLYAGGVDSAGVRIEIFQRNDDATLGDAVGTAVVTSTSDAPLSPQPSWSSTCPPGGCRLRPFTYSDVPTETQLVVRTSDALGSGNEFADLYEYDVYISASDVDSSGVAHVDVRALPATGMTSLLAGSGGLTLRPDRGLLTGEVHDCDDVRVSGATVDTDQPKEGDTFYFSDDESTPVLDVSRTGRGIGTSAVGRFLGLNLDPTSEVRVRALVRSGGTLFLAGASTVRVFPGAATTVTLRGRRAWQR